MTSKYNITSDNYTRNRQGRQKRRLVPKLRGNCICHWNTMLSGYWQIIIGPTLPRGCSTAPKSRFRKAPWTARAVGGATISIQTQSFQFHDTLTNTVVFDWSISVYWSLRKTTWPHTSPLLVGWDLGSILHCGGFQSF